jgi:integrase
MRDKRRRVYGPYRHGKQWRVVVDRPGGGRDSRLYQTEAEAVAVIQRLEESLGLASVTMEKAIESYEVYRRDKGNKPRTCADTAYRLGRFFAGLEQLHVRRLVAEVCVQRYRALTGEYAVDSHRNMLAEAKTFGRWLKAQGMIRESPLEAIQGIGRRRHGKLQPRRDEGRKWLARALELAHLGEDEAIAALMAALMGMRCSEIVRRQVRDLDDGGQLLWIPDSKTPAGKRPLWVPSLLQELLREQAEGKEPMQLLLGYHDRAWPRLWVQRICADVKMPKITAHGMRGLTATLALEAGYDPDVVAKMMGHASSTTTTQSYAAPGAGEAARQERALRMVAGGRK